MQLKRPIRVAAVHQRLSDPPVLQNVRVVALYAWGGKEGTQVMFDRGPATPHTCLTQGTTMTLIFANGRSQTVGDLDAELTKAGGYVRPERGLRRRALRPASRWQFLAFAALFVALMNIAIAALAQTDGAQPDGTITVESDRAQDFATRDRIMAILGQLDGYGDVRATVSNGIVSLRGTVVDAGRIDELNALVSRIEGVVAIENAVMENTDVVERLNPALDRMRERGEQALAFLPLIAVALTAAVLMWWFGFWLARRRWPWDRLAPNAFISDIYRQVVRLVFIVLGVVLALDLLNATALLGTILGAAGIVGLAIGFAVRDTVENFISSIMLSIRQPFRPKDLIEIGGDLGHVIRLTSRATILLSLDGNHIRIPNSTVFKSKIINYTRNDERRFTFLVGIAPDADIAQAQDIMLAALAELPFVLEAPAPAVWVEGIGASTIDINAAAWIQQHETGIGMAKGEAVRIVKARLEEAGITLPEPTYRLIGMGLGSAAAADPLVQDALPERAEVQPISGDEAQALHEIVEAEREALHDEDLLRQEAPQE